MTDRDTPIAVNSEKQLFIDNKFIAESSGVTFTMNPPQQMSEPMLVVDRPWEGFIGAYNTVLKEDGRFRLWYDVILPEGSSEIFRGIAYAESDDGIHWRKPNQNLIEFQGSKENNLVAPRLPDAPRGEMEGATVFQRYEPHLSTRRTLQAPDQDAAHSPGGYSVWKDRRLGSDVLRRWNLLAGV